MNPIEKLKEQAREEVGYELAVTDQKIRYLSELVRLRDGAQMDEHKGYTQRLLGVCDSIEQDIGIAREMNPEMDESPVRTL